MWFAEKLGSQRPAGAPTQTGLRNGKAAPQQAARAPQPARAPDTRSPPPAEPPKKKKGWF